MYFNVKNFLTHLFGLLYYLGPTLAQYNDIRCKCTCKELVALSIPHKVYLRQAVQEDCNCLHVVIEQIDAKYLGNVSNTAMHMEQYCIGCNCKYEVRSTKTMQVVVIMYLILVGALMLYMLAVWVADLIKKRRTRYEAMNDEEELVMEEQPSTSRGAPSAPRQSRRVLRSSSSGSMMMQRLSSVQEEWKKTVKNQRDQVYERRSILQ